MNEWDKAAGVRCRACNRESFQVIDGLCARCHAKRTERVARENSKVPAILRDWQRRMRDQLRRKL